jgi:hypothetical protein
MITVPAHKVRQFGVEFYETSFTSGDIQKLVKFEVLNYSTIEVQPSTGRCWRNGLEGVRPPFRGR